MTQSWDVRTESGFLAWYDATVADAHRDAARLCGSDRAAVEDVVQEAYLSVLRQAHRVCGGRVATDPARVVSAAG